MDQEPKLESKEPPENILDFLNLSVEEKEELKKRVQKCNGLVRIFVHPLFEKWRHEEDELERNHPYHNDLIQIEKTLSRILVLEEEKTPPLIIMEEEKFVPELKKWLKKMNVPLKNKVYFVNTDPYDSTPNIYKEGEETPLMDLLISANNPSNDPSWKKFEKALEEVDIKKILLGGMQFEMSETKKDWTCRDPWMARCVGIAVSHLSKDKGGKFEVELSALTAPFSERRSFYNFKRESKK